MTYPEISQLARRGVYRPLCEAAEEGELKRYFHDLWEVYDALPWLRWLRRYHLERQLILARFALRMAGLRPEW